jgi:hypothetical protein
MIGAEADNKCECDNSTPETTRHFLLECRRWNEQHQELQGAAGTRWGDLSYLLGGRTELRKPNGEHLDGKPENWKPNLEIVRKTLNFALNTKRLSSQPS